MARRFMKKVTLMTLILTVVAGILFIPYSATALSDSNPWRAQESGTTEHLAGVWGSSSSAVFAVGTGGTILRYDGNEWGPMDSGTTCDFEGIWGSSPSDMYAVGKDQNADTGVIFHYKDNLWTRVYQMDSGTGDQFIAVWGSSPDDVFAIGWLSGIILHYDGKTWSQVYDGLDGGLDGIWGNSSEDVYAVGPGGTILHYDSVEWSIIDSGTSSDLFAVWGSSSEDIFVVGDNGTIVHYNGSNWNQMTSNSTDWLYSIWGSSSTDVYAVGVDDGTILHYDGAEWTSISDDTIVLLEIGGTSSSDVFIVGGEGLILHYSGPPTITSVNPNHGRQGEALDVIITGTGFTGADVIFGEGITTKSFTVDSETQITARIAINDDATVGERNVWVNAGGRTGTLTNGFSVEKAEEKENSTGINWGWIAAGSSVVVGILIMIIVFLRKRNR